MHYTYHTKGTCSVLIDFDIEGNIVKNIHFTGGCPGNLQAISKLLEGQTVEYINEKLRGNDCRGRGTSCADQLAIAVSEAYEKEEK